MEPWPKLDLQNPPKSQLERMTEDMQHINSPLGAAGYLTCGMPCAKLG
ncbi:MAG TPA: hypothetical protein VJ729_07655 [Nitrososphaeraceae archaeon]|nr:hypothetical protein [Nitrososphaeraceae archaeon]